ncbi:hypothetical protein [Geoalkalibacter halelectricus]|uniref:Uncharacterized protein n=1 Tax=Geoalkalibacter halelectricus TaxID=2847045 RepID=A0ABY5ZSC9_9BACT|nr:hypothetical protein [Geoalkalibacter halelectricus]MDO3379887.1 hypothetical protein [Geoalkalibacter halelectricus]UWZ80584.1 hypothetical protein L9S41_04090 [Geoalkalibacter halelectricus]
MTNAQEFYWERQAAAEKLCLDLLAQYMRDNTTLTRLAERIRTHTSGRLLDWVDHLLVRDTAALRETLATCGYVPQSATTHVAWRHPGALLPRLMLVGNSVGPVPGVALRVENLADFLQTNGFAAEIEGAPLSLYRRCLVSVRAGTALWAVERRGGDGYEPTNPGEDYPGRYLSALHDWQIRARDGENEDLAWGEAERLAQGLIAQFGTDVAASVICEAERRYWQARNFAGGVQKHRQDALGLGWANQDHHTFRSSRRHFAKLVKLFSDLGFEHRERFYAGAEAGWGAQLMENPRAGLTLFLDVDLAPEEVATDFSAEELPELEQLGTVGLWCALHGDSILGAGMHHLAAQFDFPRLKEDLARHGIGFMAPFSDFSYLKQAFSVAERWPVAEGRVAYLRRNQRISAEQEEKFLAQGAIGSHLENIQRCEGYKGFNKKNVSAIILTTDPRQ